MFDGLAEEVESSALHGPNGHRNVCVPGDHDDRQFKPIVTQLLLKFHDWHSCLVKIQNQNSGNWFKVVEIEFHYSHVLPNHNLECGERFNRQIANRRILFNEQKLEQFSAFWLFAPSCRQAMIWFLPDAFSCLLISSD